MALARLTAILSLTGLSSAFAVPRQAVEFNFLKLPAVAVNNSQAYHGSKRQEVSPLANAQTGTLYIISCKCSVWGSIRSILSFKALSLNWNPTTVCFSSAWYWFLRYLGKPYMLHIRSTRFLQQLSRVWPIYVYDISRHWKFQIPFIRQRNRGCGVLQRWLSYWR